VCEITKLAKTARNERSDILVSKVCFHKSNVYRGHYASEVFQHYCALDDSLGMGITGLGGTSGGCTS
jgi:hypothetical protein